MHLTNIARIDCIDMYKIIILVMYRHHNIRTIYHRDPGLEGSFTVGSQYVVTLRILLEGFSWMFNVF